jgi:hypothetical protein
MPALLLLSLHGGMGQQLAPVRHIGPCSVLLCVFIECMCVPEDVWWADVFAATWQSSIRLGQMFLLSADHARSMHTAADIEPFFSPSRMCRGNHIIGMRSLYKPGLVEGVFVVLAMR